jgi:hypothetical protein
VSCVIRHRSLATGRSLVQRFPTKYGASEYDLETSTMRRPRPTGERGAGGGGESAAFLHLRRILLGLILTGRTDICNLIPCERLSEGGRRIIPPLCAVNFCADVRSSSVRGVELHKE